jgi:hypothetical protein
VELSMDLLNSKEFSKIAEEKALFVDESTKMQGGEKTAVNMNPGSTRTNNLFDAKLEEKKIISNIISTIVEHDEYLESLRDDNVEKKEEKEKERWLRSRNKL